MKYWDRTFFRILRTIFQYKSHVMQNIYQNFAQGEASLFSKIEKR